MLNKSGWITAGLLVAALTCISSPRVNTQNRGQAASLKLYVFDCGTLKSGNPDPLLQRGVTVTDMSVPAYLIVHPRGTLLWETGVIADDLIQPTGTTEARATANKTLRSQLAEIGYKPSDITYLALSHNHYDHSANANEFAASTWLVQKAEREVMFPATPPPNPTTASARFSALKNSKTVASTGPRCVWRRPLSSSDG
jgi:glyoxylase-like metal-dependent hydrolase (beta-lactamase superfamily II)